ncbi:unnamed protein product [Macrosiphum euphorbiae]|uniref:Uncharacterized protein n=1 Tax=Macrosiphum euphorbiae TaxID=13131 RepID=A0AAV0VJ50_9HEMI|nr:unnamed protein product [Macrosiphum euphorbiae]
MTAVQVVSHPLSTRSIRNPAATGTSDLPSYLDAPLVDRDHTRDVRPYRTLVLWYNDSGSDHRWPEHRYTTVFDTHTTQTSLWKSVWQYTRTAQTPTSVGPPHRPSLSLCERTFACRVNLGPRTLSF